jgi:beta-fructofuranosidase
MIKWGDPFVFRAQGRAFMVVGVNLKKQVTLPIWEAQDDELVSWEYRGLLLQAPKTRLEDMECPNFFPLGDKWVLLCSPGGMVRYFIGTFDPDSASFQVEKEGIVDYSVGEPFPDALTRGLYATNILVDDKDRTIMFGWVSGFKLGRGWNGCLALPRVLSIGRDGYLRQEPVPELQELREQHIRLDSLNLSNGGHVLEEPGGETLEILAVFEPGDAEAIGLKMRRSDDGREAITISYDGRTLDVAGSAVPFKLAGDEKQLTLHVFLDKTVMEVFANGGRECVTKVIYSPEQDLGLELFATGGQAMVRSLDIWHIKPIW